MGLAEIAAGIEVTDEQRETGVATVDETADSLAEALAPHESVLPCSAAVAATLVERYAAGGSVGAAARTAGVPAVTAAKTLHLVGESVSPLGPTGQEIVRDWIAGDLSRTEAIELARASETEFALAAYVETHDPIEGARAAVEGLLATGDLYADSLAAATGDPDDLR